MSRGKAAVAPANEKPRRPHYAYAIVASCIAMIGIPCAMVLSCAGIFFTPVSSYFGVSKAEFTLYFSILNGVMMVTLPIAGKVLKRLDVRVVFSACVAIDGLCYLAMSRFGAVWQFYIAGALLGVGTAPLIYLCVPTLINAWFAKRSGFFVGLCMAFTGIGGVVFNQVGTKLINSGAEGWRTGYLVFGVVMLVATLPFTVFVLRGRPEDKGLLSYGAEAAGEDAAGAAEGVPARGVTASAATRTAGFVALALFSFLITVNQTVYQFLSSYVTSMGETLPQLAALSGVTASCCMAGQAIGKVVLGVVNDRSVRGGLAFGLGFGAVGVVLMWLVPSVSVALLVGAFLFGFAYACTTVQTPLLTRGVFGSHDYTAIYSRVSTAGALGGVVASTLWSLVVDLPGGYSLMFALSLACMAACLALGVFALSRSRATE